ncbi:prolipoprotein diacylglyceryl transferase [Mucilaginibacter sp. JRF]|uniref:prolipoprotein diacylglyceryl transferase n=1 Tax=Mucilaginibacter sp. JRF TaxID=2780088 RepID=UPI0018818DF5|nr:prolipoprotein diacylglyceryl transferase family protein [Mucilaginibacter sp. JRF]MBE9586305.1 prolipoprotein diacylglyceryl transferase [Mucilaginibacter sp. JRF]
MHFPLDLHIGKLTLPVHFICETLSFFIGYRYYAYLRKHTTDAISDHNRLLIFVGAAAGAFLGSHVVGILENPEYIKHLSLYNFMANKTIVGGLLGGLIGVELVKNIIGVKTSSGDMMVYPLILAMIIGRTGCFFAGLEDGTYGVVSTLPWAINFGDGVYRHPTNLYEILFWLMLWLALASVSKKHTLADGAKFKLFMVSYLLFRFFIEFIKPAYFYSFGVSTIQLVCLGGLLYYYKVFTKPLKLIAHA